MVLDELLPAFKADLLYLLGREVTMDRGMLIVICVRANDGWVAVFVGEWLNIAVRVIGSIGCDCIPMGLLLNGDRPGRLVYGLVLTSL